MTGAKNSGGEKLLLLKQRKNYEIKCHAPNSNLWKFVLFTDFCTLFFFMIPHSIFEVISNIIALKSVYIYENNGNLETFCSKPPYKCLIMHCIPKIQINYITKLLFIIASAQYTTKLVFGFCVQIKIMSLIFTESFEYKNPRMIILLFEIFGFCFSPCKVTVYISLFCDYVSYLWAMPSVWDKTAQCKISWMWLMLLLRLWLW